MTDHTPIKRHKAIVSFSKDHHLGLLLVWKIRQGLKKAISIERISNYVLSFFTENLQNHFNEEEEMLFCKLPDGDDLRKQAEADHKAIYKLIVAISENKNDAYLLNQFADKLEKHIRFEERELFNHLQKNIGSEELAEIEKRLSNDGKTIDEIWPDPFWNIK